MTPTTTDVRAIPKVRHDEAMALAATEYGRFTDVLRGLDPGDWAASTVCDGWDVAAMVAHVLGAAEANASMRENAHQMRLGRRVQRELGLGHVVHGANEVQIRERRALGPEGLVERWERAVPRALKGRRRFPPFLRPVRIPFEEPLGKRPLAYLMDIVYTRDVWMHRVDICRATGHHLELTPAHDGRMVADMVADWAHTHRHAFSLELTGPAGGTYVNGQEDVGSRNGASDNREHSGQALPHLTIDAVEWAWTVSGRAEGTGLLEHSLPL